MTKLARAAPYYKDANLPIVERVEDLLNRMTLAEKVAQLSSAWVFELQDGLAFSPSKAAQRLASGIGQITRVGGGSILSPVDSARLANTIQNYLLEHTRLGVPAIVHEECCSGYMALGATCFPQMIGLASTWQPELAEAMTAAIRAQMRAVGAHQGLSPVLDVSRDQRWGRVEETFGEDPTLVSAMGMAYVRGLQGESLGSGVMATAKHFLGHGISEGGLNCTPVHVGPRELRDVFLMPFEAAIQEAGLSSIMNAYSELDEEVVAGSRAIMTGLLKEEVGFNGLVVSDYNAIDMLFDYHRTAHSPAEAAYQALHAGIDVELPTTSCYGEPLLAAVQNGDIPETLIDTSLSSILHKKFELGLFENPYVDLGLVEAVYDTPEQRSLARQIARQSMVLLKNDGDLLPLPKNIGTLALIGPNAHEGRHLLGDYSHPAHIEALLYRTPESAPGVAAEVEKYGYMVGTVAIPTLLDAVRQAVSPNTQLLYAQGCHTNNSDRSGFEAAVQAASQAEVVVLAMGDKAGLNLDSTSGEARDRADLGLPGVQAELISEIAALGKPIVLVLINGRPYAIPDIIQHTSAVLEAWLPGEEGGPAITDVLFGDVNPGGRLPISVPRSVGQLPVFYNHKPSGGRSHWHGDYVELSTRPLYPFGYGLSYTRFEYSGLHIEPAQVEPEGMVKISCQVMNSGELQGDEVVQLYIRDEVASIPRPVKELKGFLRVPLSPGETRTVEFELPVNQLAFYNADLCLVVESGQIQVMVGASSEDIRLCGSFVISGCGKYPVSRRAYSCPARAR